MILRTLEAIREVLSPENRVGRVTFTNGCFDLLHPGHVSFLLRASHALPFSKLVVAVNTDASVRSLKGEGRPIITLEDRLLMLDALKCVEHLIPFDSDDPSRIIEIIKPDLLVKGPDWADRSIAGMEHATATMALVSDALPYSTTSLISYIRDR